MEVGGAEHEDLMLGQVIEFLRGAFDNLKAHAGLARVALPDVQPVQVDGCDGMAAPATEAAVVPASVAPALQSAVAPVGCPIEEGLPHQGGEAADYQPSG